MVLLKTMPTEKLIKSFTAGEFFRYEDSLYMRLQNGSSEQSFGPKAVRFGTGKIMYFDKTKLAKIVTFMDTDEKEES